MAEIVLGTFADEAELEVSTDRRSQITVTLRITIDDREKIRALMDALGDWLADTTP